MRLTSAGTNAVTPRRQRAWGGVAADFVVALAAIVVATLARWLLDPALGNHLPYVTYFVAVAFVAWYAGLWPSILTMLAGWLAADFFFVPPRGALIWHGDDPVYVVGTATYFMVAIATILVSEAMHAARRRAEAHRKALRVTLLSIGDAVIATDDAARIDFMNSTAEALTGWTASEAQGKPLEDVFKIVNEETREAVANPATRALEEGVIVGLANHTVLIAKDGSERAIDDSASPIRDDEGDSIGAVLVFRDIAERRKAELALQKSQALNAGIVNAAIDGIITIDHQGNVIEFNPAAEQIFGYRRDEVLGREMAALIIPAPLRERHRRGIARYLQTGEGPVLNHRLEMTALRADGSEFTAEISITCVITEHGPPAFTGHIRDITERQRTEAALRHSEAELSDFFQNASVGLHWVGPDGTILRVNQAELDLLGYDREEYVGRHIAEFHADQPMIEDILARLTRGEELREYPARLRCKDGSIRDVLISSSVRFEDGRFIHTRCFTFDITERKHIEQALAESEERYRTLFNSMDEGYCIIEVIFDEHETPIDYRFLEVNFAFEKQSGMHDVTGRRMLEYVSGIEEHWLSNYGSVALTGLPVRFAGQYKGLNRWFEVYAFRVGEPGSHTVAVLFTDITERRQAEEATARLAAIVTFSEDAIISKDLDGVITTWNKGAEHLFGYTAEEAIGQAVIMLIPEDHLDEEPEILDRIRRGKAIDHYETVRQRKDGSRLHISLSVSPLRDASEKVIGASKVARDITDQVKMQKKVAEQAEQIAGESRRKDEFLAMLSHEIRNPLAPIRSAVHLLRLQERGSENAVQQQAREIIERQVANLTKIVSDLLEVSRVISGRIRLDQQIVDLNQVVAHAAQTAMPLIEQRGHKLVMNLCGDEGVWANADATRMEEVFVNLLNNAAKYTDEGGRIEVWCEHPQGQDYVQIRIRDNGLGISPELLPRIFDLFTQADRTLDRSQGGLGIGLSLVHRLVEMHGGTIEAHSPPQDCPHERGSEFIVKLPLVPAPGHAPAPVPAAEPPRPEGVRVLLVDDNIDMVMMLASSLRQKGYSVQSAYNGPDGLKVAQQWRPDVVLLDIGLPGLDGYEVARRIRAAPELDLKKARLVALTGYGRDVDKSLAEEAGFDAHITKPYDFDELTRAMALQK